MADDFLGGFSPGGDFGDSQQPLGDITDETDGVNFDEFVHTAYDGQFGETSPSGGSPDCFSDSSSKRAKSISSTKTSAPGDQLNPDGIEFKAEWREDAMLVQGPPNPVHNDGTVSLAAMERTDIADNTVMDMVPLHTMLAMGPGVQAPSQSAAPNDHLSVKFDFNFGQSENTFFSPQHLDLSMADRSREVSPTSATVSSACSPHNGHPVGYGFSGLANLTPSMGPHNWASQPLIPVMPMGLYSGLRMPMPPRLSITAIAGMFPVKSRVETQIHIRLAFGPLPLGVKSLHLPTYCIAKPKLLSKPSPPEPKAEMYELQTVLVCTSAMDKAEVRAAALDRARRVAQQAQFKRLNHQIPEEPENGPDPQDGGPVVICEGCKLREKKRAMRKKNKKAEEEAIWVQNEDRRVVVFNTQEVKDWQQPQDPSQSIADYNCHSVDIPMRIACYCRHHHEKLGFQVIFTLMDSQGNIIAQELSPSIMITDDHKTPGTNAPAESQAVGPVNDPQSQRSTSEGAMAPVTPVSQMQEQLPTPRRSRPASPRPAPTAKRRKKSHTPKVHNSLSMTPIEPAAPPGMQFHGLQHPHPSATSPLASAPQGFGAPGFPGAMGGAPPMAQSFNSSPSPLGDDEQVLSNANVTPVMENMNVPPALSAPPSGPTSRAPSPGTSRRQMEEQIMGTFNQLYAPSALPESPVIHRIIPPEGPKSGGIEVCIFGNNIPRDVAVVFGEREAVAVTHWGPKAITCILPPATGPCHVPVSLKQGALHHFQRDTKFFRYIDNDEDQLMRKALEVLSMKLHGTSSPSDVMNFANKLIHGGPSGGAFPSWGAGEGGAGGNGAGSSRSQGSLATLEARILQVLDLIDVVTTPQKPRYNHPVDKTGQTMMHLACSLGFAQLVTGLIRRGASSDTRDRGGYTPLHFAALNGHCEIVRYLIQLGADPTVRSLKGLTAADMASSDEIIRVLRNVGDHQRTRSRASLVSACSSIASLSSLWEPPSQLEPVVGADPTPDEESPEYSSFEDEDSASDDEDIWLPTAKTIDDFHPRDVTQETDIPKAASSPTLKDQFAAQWQQFHQSMVQNLPQFRQLPQLSQLPYMPQFPNMPQLSQLPYLPQFPNVPLLPEYQAAMLQRLAAMMPARGYRSGSTGSQSLGKEVDSSPPPAYEEIFPQKQSSAADIKQESAARAALEAEGDAKCAALFESPTDETESSPSVETTDEVQEDSKSLPLLLQIGRKNAITKQQQENLRRAHAERLRGLSGDRNLFFIWIPLLLLVSAAMFYGTMPGMFSAAMDYFTTIINSAQDEMQQLVRSGQGRVVEELQ